MGEDRGFERSVARRQSFGGASPLLSVAAFLELPGGDIMSTAATEKEIRDFLQTSSKLKLTRVDAPCYA